MKMAPATFKLICQPRFRPELKSLDHFLILDELSGSSHDVWKSMLAWLGKKDREKDAAKGGWTVVTHIKGWKKPTESAWLDVVDFRFSCSQREDGVTLFGP